jgi:hypothetical protein
MAFQNPDEEPAVEEAGPPPEENSNRPFILAAAILGGIVLLSLLCILGYALFLRPMLTARDASRRSTAVAVNAATGAAATLTVEAQSFTATPTNTPPLPTITKTPTPVVVIATNTSLPAGELTTATFQALQTTVAASKLTLTPGATATGLPTSGWADEVGAPTLVMIAAALILVIFLVRRLRTSGT